MKIKNLVKLWVFRIGYKWRNWWAVKRMRCIECGNKCEPNEIFEYPSLHERQRPSQTCLCPKHAKQYGFCYYCHGFFGGVESFDFNGSSCLCTDCKEELDNEVGYENEFESYYDDLETNQYVEGED